MIAIIYRWWLQQLNQHQPRRWQAFGKRPAKRGFRPQLEGLEERVVPAAITPAQLRAAYGIDQIKFGTGVGNGAGQTIGIPVIGVDATIITDLQYFDQQLFGPGADGAGLLDTFGSYSGPVPGSTKPWFDIMQDSNPNADPNNATSNDLETAEDAEWAHAIAPMANILIVETGNIASGAGFAAKQTQLGVSVVAVSSSHHPTPNTSDDYTEQPGVTFVAITGDTGTSINSGLVGYSNNNWPASTPNVIAVGGTTLTLNADGSYGSETGWGFAGPNRFLTSGTASYSPASSWASTSGGFSGSYETAPAAGATTTATWMTTVMSSDTLGKNDLGLEFSATWTPSPGNSANAQYIAYAGYGTPDQEVLATATVNQQLAPNGTPGTLGSKTATFQELFALNGKFIGPPSSSDNIIVGESITVVLQGSVADGKLVADAIGIGPDDASGGGMSDDPFTPDFQSGLVIHDGSSVISSGGRRSTPDVAFDGDYINSPVVIYSDSTARQGAGTSLGAPCWGALIAIADQGLALGGDGPMDTATALDGLYSLPASDFHDETSGYNGYSAGTGYDLVTGLGSPVANQLITGLVSAVAPSGPLVYSAPEGQGANNLAIILQGTSIEILRDSQVVASAPLAKTTAIDIIGANSTTNSLTINYGPPSNLDPLATGPTSIPVTFDGGSLGGGGTLILEGGTFTDEADTAIGPHSGTLTLDTTYTSYTSIAYTNLAPIIDTTTVGTLTINDHLPGDHITVQNGPNSPDGTPTSEITGSGFEKVDLANKGSVNLINPTFGSDTLNLIDPLVNNGTFNLVQTPEFTDAKLIFSAFVGLHISFDDSIPGSPAPTYIVSAGALPTGLTIDKNGGLLHGQFTAAGIFGATILASNGINSVTQDVFITVIQLVLSSPTITPSQETTVVQGTGVKLTASATLAGGNQETGTITFTLYAPNGAVVDTETVPVHGDGVYTTPQGYLSSVSGTYQWVVGYSGDDSNNSVSTSNGSTPEVVVGPGAAVVGNVLYLVGGSNTSDQVAITPVGSSKTGSTGIQVSATLNGVNSKNTYSPSSIYIVGFAGNDNILLASTLTIAAVIKLGDGNDNLLLDSGNTTITAGNGNDNFFLGNANNTITVGNGNNNFLLGGGNNTLTAGSGCEIVLAGGGNNVVTLGNGNDNVLLGSGANTVTVGNGNDLVLLGNGNNVVVAGNGNDDIYAGDGTNSITAGAVGSTGNVQVHLGNGANDQVALRGNGNDGVQIGNGNDDSVSVTGNGNDQIQVGNGNNDSISLIGNGNEIIQTGSGTGMLHIVGADKKTLHIGKGWTQS